MTALVRAGAVAGLVGAMILGLPGLGSQNASAASGQKAVKYSCAGRTCRADICFPGVCGSATFTFTDRHSLHPVVLSVKDNKADGRKVYIRITSLQAYGYYKTDESLTRWDKSGPKGKVKELRGHLPVNKYVQVKACVSRKMLPDKCKSTEAIRKR
jgi:hypothetical protein